RGGRVVRGSRDPGQIDSTGPILYYIGCDFTQVSSQIGRIDQIASVGIELGENDIVYSLDRFRVCVRGGRIACGRDGCERYLPQCIHGDRTDAGRTQTVKLYVDRQ